MLMVREAKPSDMESIRLLDKQTMLDQIEKGERLLIKDFDRYHDEFWHRMTQSSGTAFYVTEDSDGNLVGMNSSSQAS